MPDRDSALAAVRAAPRTQVLIIGGGINGIGTFRDLALQGVEVLLVERGDFASGASAASSHMIHGGIRYLENGELRLVRESVQERNRLLRLAPHYVRPLPTTIPIFSTFSGVITAPLRLLLHRRAGRPKERGALLIKVGLVLYDTFSRGGGLVPRHRFLGRRKSLAALPDLNPALKYTATYYDASVHDPERLALDVLRDGLEAGPHARAVNYVEAIGVDAAGIHLRDLESGAEFSVTADLVINTSGPWTDLTNAALDSPTAFMGGTKGSHLVLDHRQLFAATGGREIFFENDDGRIVLIYPLKGRVLVGTSDLDADPTEPAVCTPEEVEYFLKLVAHVYPGIPVEREQIVYAYSGIRPLPRHEDTAPGFVSRDYRVETAPAAAGRPAIVSLVGGKWTTFRAVAEHVTDTALGLLDARRVASTEDRPVGGGAGYPTEADRTAWLAAHLPGVPAARADVLLARYGTRAVRVAEHLDLATDRPLATLPDGELSTGELAWMLAEEWATHLTDVVLRRTSLAFRGLLSRGVLDELAAELGVLAGWTAARRRSEVSAVVAALEAQGVVLG